jgi:DNA-binding LacI/PurR family transcriptional regulator
VLDANYENLDVNFIVMNNVLGTHQAATHMHSLGHKEIGYVQSNSGMFNFDSRRHGFNTALKEHGIKLDPCNVFTAHPTMLNAQEEFKEQWLKRTKENKPLPTALFCECDYLAISTIKSLAELGVSVPDDISIVGFDNINESMVITPELTTIHVEKEQMAVLTVERLIQIIENKNEIKMKTLVDTKLVERKSCAVPKSRSSKNTEAML